LRKLLLVAASIFQNDGIHWNPVNLWSRNVAQRTRFIPPHVSDLHRDGIV